MIDCLFLLSLAAIAFGLGSFLSEAVLVGKLYTLAALSGVGLSPSSLFCRLPKSKDENSRDRIVASRQCVK